MGCMIHLADKLMSQAAADLIHLSVFLSSPGDVREERSMAREVLGELPRQPLLRGKVSIETVAWDDPDALPRQN
jgi:hypothetical protein